jgi:hypothetical protein
VYGEKRYMTVTGEHRPTTPVFVYDRQDVLTAWHERVFKVEARAQQNTGGGGPDNPPVREDAELVKALSKPSYRWSVGFDELYYRGDLLRFGEDFSRGLFMLALMLARETHDPAQIERIVKASKLYRISEAARKKWDAKRGESTWGSQLIASAL